VIKTLKMTLNGHDEIADLAKKGQGVKEPRRSMEDR